MALRIVPVPPHMVEVAEGVIIDMPAVAYIGLDGDEIVGSGGLAWGRGRCWVWLKVAEVNPRNAITILHWTKRMLAKARQLGESEVFTPRDALYPTSEKLLTVLGFEFREVTNGIEVWGKRLTDERI